MWGGRSTKRQRVDMRHERAMDIRDQDVTVVSETQWRIASQGAGTGRGHYDVKLESANCPQRSCRDWDKCFADGCAGLCAHMFRCSCPDENTLCKHIHKVRILNVRATQAPAQQRATASADQRWRREGAVASKVKRARSALKEIEHSLDRFDCDALDGVIDEALDQLESVSASIYCHCEDYENNENDGGDDEDDDEEDDEEDE